MILSVITQVMSFLEAYIIVDCLYNLKDAISVVFKCFYTVRRVNTKLQLGAELKARRMGRCGRKRITSARDDRKI